MKQVGIPRAMGYYYLYPFFRSLLEELGAKPVLSPPTSPRLLERMDSCPTDEPCLAVKLHFSHADTLARRPEIDFLFLPIIARVERTSCCPKFIGIADMTRHGLRLPEERVLMPVLDYSDTDREMQASLQPLAERLGVTDRYRLSNAIQKAREAQRQHRDLCVTRQLTTAEAYRLIEHGTEPPARTWPEDSPTIAVIGHPYIIYEVVSHDMIDRLREYGPVIAAEMVDPEACTREMATIEEGNRLWPFEANLLGAALHLLREHKVDKLVLVGSFECGPESIIEAYIEEEAERQGIPFMVLALDEHSGEAGLVTRLEAFMDTDKVPHEASPPVLPTPHVTAREELVVGFPSMGHLGVAITTLLDICEVRSLPTPRALKTCVEMGRELAPEFVCFPFTATLGQMRLALDQGANALLMVGGKGYCRLGWYAQVQEKLLRNMGYNFQLFTVNAPTPLRTHWKPFSRMLKGLTGQASWPRIMQAVYTAYQQLSALDRAEAAARRLRAFEREQGTADRLVDRFFTRMAKLRELPAMRALERDFMEEVAAVETEDTNPLRIRIAGEIWVVLEQAANMDVERWLGRRDRPRVWVEREHSASFWMDSHVLNRREAARRAAEIVTAARPWLTCKVGGDGEMTIGQVALAPREGMDGVLHIFPFTCMPEIIAQNIIVSMSEELDVPVLTYIVSEQTGEAGMETRLESFLDVMEERRDAHRSANVYA
ncbi:MAG: acyl-CoA dehydratase activase-related protein [Armatimonadota bacterium]